jgi:phage gp29-like protein
MQRFAKGLRGYFKQGATIMQKKLWINENQYILFNESKKPLSEELATRKRAINYFNLSMNLPDPDPILKKQGKDITIYKELLSDAHVWACIQSRKAGVLSLEWDIDRGKAKSRQAKIIESLFDSLDLYAIISEILNASLFGFQPLEILWQKDGNLIIPSNIKAKPAEWFVFDDENNLKLKTKENRQGDIVPDKKFLCPQYNPSYENPYGERTLSRVFWPVTFKKGGVKFWVIFTEKYGMPFLIGKHPRGTSKEDTDNLADMLETMVQDAIAVIPDDSSVEIHEAGGKGASADIYDRLIDKMNAEISKAILGQTLTTEIGDKGSYAASNTHMSVRADIVDADKKMVEKTLNQLIKWIYELNFSAEISNIPTFTMWEEEDVDLTLAQRDKILTDTGIKFSKNYFIKTYGLEEDDIEEMQEKEEKPAFSEFNEPADFEDQKAIDQFIDSLSEKELQGQAEVILKSVIDLIQKGNSYEEILESLSENHLNTNSFERYIEKALFISEIYGRINGKD